MPDVNPHPTGAGVAPAATPSPESPLDRPGPSLAGVLGGAQGLGRLELIAVLRADQLQRWQRGRRVPAEAYLREVPALRDDPELAIDLIFSEFVLRRDVLGEAPSLDEYVERFPDYATALRRQGDLEALWQEGARTQGRGRPAPPTAAAPPSAAEWTVFGAGCDAPAATAHAPSVPGYEVLGELGRGGMGLVLKGHDLHLGRDLAVKLLREEYQDQPHLVRRFLNEARICGRLQHPGVVPVYELGELPDRRPYFTMKLVEGRTLAELLDERADPGQDLPRLLGVFEQVCQALAYAHSKGVIHRDLKPANVMVGAFGEVQVMDWGLAKVLDRGGEGTAAQAPSSAARVGGPADAEQHLRTQSGGVLGTLPYMPPEQARGEVERMDERCDVFGLGAILCEILTGRPPFAGRDGAELLARAKACDHAEALARLEACGAGAELVRLAKGCLAAEPGERPRDAGVVARGVAAYLAGVQERLRGAEVERAAAQARAEEARATVAAERRARRRAAWLVAVGLLLALLASGVALGWAWQRTELARGVNSDLGAVAEALRARKVPEAKAVLQRAEDRLGGGGPGDIRQRVRQARNDLNFADRLDEVRLNASALLDAKADMQWADRTYATLFREGGLAGDGEEPETVAARIRGSVISHQLVAALDDWAVLTKDPARRAWLLEVAYRVQPDAWRERLRDPSAWENAGALGQLVGTLDGAELSAHSAVVLGSALLSQKVDAVPLLTAAVARHPNDFWLNLQLGHAFLLAHPEQAIEYCRAAVALRPDTGAAWNNLGHALQCRGRLEEAIAAYHQAIALAPGLAQARSNLGLAWHAKGRLDEALAEQRRATDIAPESGVLHYNLGNALRAKGLPDQAIEEYKKALALGDEQVKVTYNLGVALHEAGRPEEAIDAYRQVLDLDPGHVKAHNNLALVLKARGQLEEAIAEYQQAVALAPELAAARYNLGNALREGGWLDEAITQYQKAASLQPKDIWIHVNLGAALQERGRVDEAIAEYQRAIALDTRHVFAHFNLGNAWRHKGRPDEAVAEYEKVVALDPTDAWGYGALGETLLELGHFAKAAEATRRCFELLADKNPRRRLTASQLEWCERLLALERKLPALLREEAPPGGPEEGLALAWLCQACERRYVASARLYAGAFADQPRLAEDLSVGHRYSAARAAALAGCGQGEDAKRLPDKVTLALRRRALGWLRADLALWTRQLDGGKPADRAEVRQAMQHWQRDTDLAGVRDKEGLIKLPEAERPEWRQLWDDVAALLARAGAAP